MSLLTQLGGAKSAAEIAAELRDKQRPATQIIEGMQEAIDVAKGKAKPFKEHKPKPAGERLIKSAKGMRKQVQEAAVKEALSTEPKRRGRPPGGVAKQVFTIRLEPDLIDAIKGTGERHWARLVTNVLRKHFTPDHRG